MKSRKYLPARIVSIMLAATLLLQDGMSLTVRAAETQPVATASAFTE